MRGIVCLVLATACVVSALPTNEQSTYSRYIDFPGEDGKMYKVDLEAEPDMDALNEVLRDRGAQNQYFLFTRRNPDTPQTLVIGDQMSIWNSNYQSWNPTAVVVHGWLGNQNANLNELITEAFLSVDDYNVIVLDWRRLARLDYITAVRGVPSVGRALGEFIRFLRETTSPNLEQFHLVGFSLGAHVVGNAGRTLDGQIGRITGLDPAGPLWNLNSNKLKANDAIYVEGIHTNGGLAGLGIGSAIGDVDFFPNGGNSQPGCLTPICDHNRAWKYFAASVKYNHLLGRGCRNNLQLTLNRCTGEVFPMGNADLNKRGSGLFRVETGRNYPY